MPMGTKIAELPVPKTFPKAEWVTAPPAGTGRKPYTDIGLQAQVITAEEVAAVIAIPEVYLDDNEINLWNFCRPRLAEAIGVAVDDAMIFGAAGATPASFPAGGVVGAAQNVANGDDAVDGVNRAMSLVEADGLAVTGHAADLVVKGRLRGVRDETGALLLGTEQVGRTARPTLYGVQIAYNPFTQLGVGAPDFITGAWEYLIIGVRQNIRFKLDPSGVILGSTTANSVSGFQDNVVPMKVWARFGCTIVSPPTVRRPAGSRPFAKVKLSTLGARPRRGRRDQERQEVTTPGRPAVAGVGTEAVPARRGRVALRPGRGHRRRLVGRRPAPGRRPHVGELRRPAATRARRHPGHHRGPVGQLRAGATGRRTRRGHQPRPVAPQLHHPGLGAAGHAAARRGMGGGRAVTVLLAADQVALFPPGTRADAHGWALEPEDPPAWRGRGNLQLGAGLSDPAARERGGHGPFAPSATQAGIVFLPPDAEPAEGGVIVVRGQAFTLSQVRYLRDPRDHGGFMDCSGRDRNRGGVRWLTAVLSSR